MSCSEVMYQAYYPYLYQRPSTSPVSRPPAFPPFPQYDRFGMQPRSSLEQSQSPVGAGPGDVFISPGGGAGSVSSAGSPSSPASLHAAPSSAHSKESSSKTSAPAANSEDAGDDEVDSGGGEGDGRAGAAQYVSANCVVFTHYSGDAAAVVDEHFSRALSQTASAAAPTSASVSSAASTSAAGGFAGTEPGSGGKAAGASKEATSPMSARNFPPSFWNSDYQQHQMSAPSTSHHHHHDLYSSAAAAAVAAAAAASGSDPYHHHHHVHHHQATSADPWHYHQPAYRAAVHDFTAYNNMAVAAGRFTTASQYGPLLLAPSASAHPPPPPPPPPPSAPVRPPARHQYLSSSKSAGDWSSRLHELETAAPGSTHPLVDGPSHASHSSSYVAAHAAYGSMAGLEGQVQEPSKDLYWF